MKLDWFDTKEVEAFGAELADFLLVNIKPNDPERKRIATAKNKDVMRKLAHKVEKFKVQHKLNFYKKAKFGNTFQWKLKDVGYDEQFISELTKELLLKM